MLLHLFILLTLQVCHVAISCPTNEKLGVCDGGANFPQLYCPGVDIEVNKWTCKPRKKIRCVCSGELRRSMDGKCVREEQCGKYTMLKANTHQSGGKYGDTSQLLPVDNYERTISLLKSFSTIELLMMSEETWVQGDCICMKSVFLAAGIEGAERTVECYAYRKISGAPPKLQGIVGMERMLKMKATMHAMGST
ncbi:uncharacterized protein LOC119175529 isoform X2 [Rhipicephalus microplus]|uniref:uncharacterized protein LOC119175529 isoform X2 n=1 Tax=Rhipicephalus microplus TaxID=6941 RepID=UPI003F6B4D48